jgi:UDP-3-O-[3-hydroxymyristoyl] N-acetylglucosamine deacetylase/3-hydroxyacyl-[acyl-carrier-protein] dehydratase
MDGSSKYFVEALKSWNRRAKCQKKYLRGERSYFIYDEASGSEILVMPNDHYSVTTMVDFGTKIFRYTKCNDEKYLI